MNEFAWLRSVCFSFFTQLMIEDGRIVLLALLLVIWFLMIIQLKGCVIFVKVVLFLCAFDFVDVHLHQEDD